MQDDERCCGTGTCIIDALGHCWCGQQWDGTQMCRPAQPVASPDKQQASLDSPATGTQPVNRPN